MAPAALPATRPRVTISRGRGRDRKQEAVAEQEDPPTAEAVDGLT